jgi:hypothetical protein
VAGSRVHHAVDRPPHRPPHRPAPVSVSQWVVLAARSLFRACYVPGHRPKIPSPNLR